MAVVVSHDGAGWLPRTLGALREQRRAPDLVVGVDTGSTDDSALLLRQALGPANVVELPRTTGYGDAVRAGIAQARARSGTQPDGSQVPPPDWFWLLHDDSAAQPAALALQLDTAAASTSVGVVGATIVDWHDADLLVEVGLSVTRSGARRTGLDGVERDQGQHDHRTDVLAVPSAGMLVRATVWDELGGFDPALPLLRDDIDLCWRAQLAGHRVMLSPRAVVADAQASTRGLRSVDAVPAAVRRVDLQHGQHVALARCGTLALPFVLGWLILVAFGRSLALLAAKAPRRALAEIRAVAVTVFLPWRWLASRWRSRGRRRVPRSSLSALMTPRFAAVRQAGEVVSGWAGREHDPEQQPATVEAAEPGPTADEVTPVVLAAVHWPRRVARHPLTWVVGLLAAASAVAWRQLSGALVGPGTLAGGELRGGSADAAQLWHAGTDAVRGAGLGTSQVASGGAVVHAGWTWLVTRVAGDTAAGASLALMLLAVPVLAGLAAYLAAGVATRSRWLRAWAALAWGAAPVLTAAVGQGRVGPAAVAVLLPLVAAAMARGLSREVPGTLTASFAACLGLAALASAVPAAALIGSAVALGGVLLAAGGARWRALLMLVLPPLLLGPWLVSLVQRPRLLLAGPGAVADAAGSVQVAGLALPAAWADLLAAGRPGLRDLLPGGWTVLAVAVWLLPLVVLGAVGLLRGGTRGRAVTALGAVGVVGLGWAASAPFVEVSTSGPSLTAWSGSGALVGLLALLALPVVAADGLSARLARHGFGWRQLALAPLVVLAVLAPLSGLVGWAWQGTHGPVRHTAGTGLPAVAADAAHGPSGTRTLVLVADAGQLSYRLDGGEPGAVARDVASVPVGGTAASVLRGTVESLTSPGVRAAGADLTGSLQEFAVGFVLLREPVPAAVADRLDATAGLARIGRSADGQMWRVGRAVGAEAARARLVADQDGRSRSSAVPVPVDGPHARIDTTIGAGPQGRLLVLAEPASSVRWAEVDGVRLRAVTLTGDGSWRQAFAVPADGGHLVVRTHDGLLRGWQLAQALLVALVALLALPVRRPNGDLR